MPSPERLRDFVNVVVANRHVEAIETFYLDDAVTQENEAEPTVGKAAILERERNALSRVTDVRTHPPRVVVAQGDHVVLQWIFEMTRPDGIARRLEELALQTWEGEFISSERFFYDTATAWQPVAAKPSAAA